MGPVTNVLMGPALGTRSATRRIKEDAVTKLTDLPEELLLCIAQELPLTQLPTLGSTSKLLGGVARNGTLWTHIEFPSTIAVRRRGSELVALRLAAG